MAATADDHVNRSGRGVHQRRIAALRRRGQQSAPRQDAADREAPLEVVLMTGHDQVHAVSVEQRQPLLPDPQISAVEMRRRHRDLVHADHDPVDVV